MKLADAVGKRFGLWTVARRGVRRSYWVCLCDCGNEREVLSCNITSGKSCSCGCVRDAETVRRSTTHGMAPRDGRRHPDYAVWISMKQRCENPANSEYRNYGARGIRVCERWASSFASFASDMGPRLRGKSIDRIDVNGNYEPGNCRWATAREQSRNRRDNHWIEWHGTKMVLVDWANEIGICEASLRERLERGWPLAKALTTGRSR